MGSAEKQGPLWGAAPRDWAEIAEPGQVPFYEAAFEALGVESGTSIARRRLWVRPRAAVGAQARCDGRWN